MNKKTLSPKIFVFASFFFAVALIVEQIFVYLRFYDFDMALWLHETPTLMKGLVYITIVLTVLFAVAFAFTEKKNEKNALDNTHPTSVATRGISLVCLLALLATLVAQLAAIGSFDHLYLLLVSDSNEYVAIAAFLHRVTLILMPFACIWFVQLVRGKKASVGFGIFPILYLMALTLRVYFDMNKLLSDPRWTFRVITLIAMLLFMVMEVRLLVQPKRRFWYQVTAVTAMCISASSGVTNLIFHISGHLHEGIEIVYYVFELAFAAYIAVRFLTLAGESEEDADDMTEEDATEEALAEEQEEPLTEPQESEELSDPEDAEEVPFTEEELEDLTEEEVKNFYKAVTLSVRLRNDLSDPPTPEEEKAVKEESLAIIAAVLQNEDRNARIAAVRAFLAKADN